jgi:hypothetical protein
MKSSYPRYEWRSQPVLARVAPGRLAQFSARSAVIGILTNTRWLPLTGRNQYGHVTSKSINNPVSSRRKYKLFSSQRHYFTLGSEEVNSHLPPLCEKSDHCKRHSSTTYTVRDTTLSDRLLQPLGNNSTNRLGQQTHIDGYDGYRRHRILHGRHSPSSTR